eukprot:366489-Chlamydomonas_euryale.AAC.11
MGACCLLGLQHPVSAQHLKTASELVAASLHPPPPSRSSIPLPPPHPPMPTLSSSPPPTLHPHALPSPHCFPHTSPHTSNLSSHLTPLLTPQTSPHTSPLHRLRPCSPSCCMDAPPEPPCSVWQADEPCSCPNDEPCSCPNDEPCSCPNDEPRATMAVAERALK